MKDAIIARRLKEGLSKLEFTEKQHQDMLRQIVNGGKKQMKKRISLSAVIALALIFLTVTGALAASGAFEKLKQVWLDSFSRMNTTGALDIVEDFDKEEFEDRYGGVKEDLVISTVPKETDLTYDEAYLIARQAILDAFGTPEEELDAMGVYPQFFNTPYEDEINEWDFYFTARRDVNIDEDHSYDAPGEYRVHVASPGGEVTMCIWYLDTFWPDYALRTWNAGKRDYVYEKAAREGTFYTMPREQREEFIELFREAGYDTEKVEKDTAQLLNGSLWWDVACAEPEENLIDQDNPSVRAVLKVMEETRGISKEQMKRYSLILLPSPIPSETEDYCVAYNMNLFSLKIERGELVNQFEMTVGQYPERLGFFIVKLDPNHQVLEIEHADRTVSQDGFIPSDKLLGREHWQVEDLKEYETLKNQAIAIDQAVLSGEITKDRAMAKFDTLMRDYGANPADFPWREGDEGSMRKSEAFQAAREAVMEQTGLTESQFVECYPRQKASYAVGEAWTVTLMAGEESGKSDLEVNIGMPGGAVSILEVAPR